MKKHGLSYQLILLSLFLGINFSTIVKAQSQYKTLIQPLRCVADSATVLDETLYKPLMELVTFIVEADIAKKYVDKEDAPYKPYQIFDTVFWSGDTSYNIRVSNPKYEKDTGFVYISREYITEDGFTNAEFLLDNGYDGNLNFAIRHVGLMTPLGEFYGDLSKTMKYDDYTDN